MSNVTVESAERTARGRAALMAIAAAILLLNAVLVIGDPNYAVPNWRGATWILVTAIWLFLLANGGGLRLRGRMRQLLNDELSLQNRGSAYAWGFVATLLAGIAIYLAAWSRDISVADALRLTTGAGLATALLRFARLEWK
jgi:peptidoglycan/LPS O-acetylase OafA/YrhL